MLRPGIISVAAVAMLSLVASPAVAQTAQLVQGSSLYESHCALCHGAEGRGGQGFPRPIWGPGHDLRRFGTAQGLFEYLRLFMPFDDPQKLNDAQKLAVTAYVLERNASLAAGSELTPASAAGIAIK